MTKRYEHIGLLPLMLPPEAPTLRVETGEVFEFDLAPELETFLLNVGLIREATTTRSPVTAMPMRGREPEQTVDETDEKET